MNNKYYKTRKNERNRSIKYEKAIYLAKNMLRIRLNRENECTKGSILRRSGIKC